MSETLGRLSIVLDARIAQFEANVAKAEARLTRGAARMRRDTQQIDASFSSLAQTVLATAQTIPLVGTALAGLSVAGIVTLIRGAVDAVGGLGELADQAGVSTDALQVLNYASTQVGVSAEEMQRGLAALTRRIADAASGEKEAEEAFKRLGVRFAETSGAARPTERVLLDLADRMQAITNPTERAALATSVFGDRIGQRMIPLLRTGREGLEAMAAQAVAFGAVADADLIAKADEAADKIAGLQSSFGSLARNLIAQVAPALSVVADGLNRIITGRTLAEQRTMLVTNQAQLRAQLETLQAEQAGPQMSAAPRRGTIQRGLVGTARGQTGQDRTSIAAELRQQLSEVDAELAALDAQAEAARKRAEDILNPPTTGTASLPRRAASDRNARAQREGLDVRGAVLASQLESADALDAINQRLNLQSAGLEGASGALQQYERDMDAIVTALARGVITEEEYARRVEETTLAFGQQVEGIRNRGQETVDVGRELGRILPTAFEDAVTNGKKLGDVFAGLSEDVAKLILRLTVMVPLANSLSGLFSGTGKSGSGGLLSTIGSSIASAFGGGSSGGAQVAGAKADGGPVMAGRTYLVGERGPELFTPPGNGMIVPNHAMGGTTITFAPVNNIDARGADPSMLPRMRAIADQAAARSLAQFADNINRGGTAAKLVGRR